MQEITFSTRTVKRRCCWSLGTRTYHVRSWYDSLKKCHHYWKKANPILFSFFSYSSSLDRLPAEECVRYLMDSIVMLSTETKRKILYKKLEQPFFVPKNMYRQAGIIQLRWCIVTATFEVKRKIWGFFRILSSVER